MTEIQCTAFLGEGIVPERTGNGQGLMNTYECQDGWVLMAAASDNIWPRVCDAIEAPEWLEDARLKTRGDRDREWQLLEERMQAWCSGCTVQDVVERFSTYGIPVNAVNEIPAAAHDPQLHERELLVEVPDPIAGKIHVSGKNIKLSRSEVVVGSAALPGQHTEAILTDLLNYNPEKIDSLEAAGAVYRAEASASNGSSS
jgi:crotonobetainyl-CoA:carnitine CoA-transferase CaiB-like acyl-CoA transferase